MPGQRSALDDDIGEPTITDIASDGNAHDVSQRINRCHQGCDLNPRSRYQASSFPIPYGDRKSAR